MRKWIIRVDENVANLSHPRRAAYFGNKCFIISHLYDTQRKKSMEDNLISLQFLNKTSKCTHKPRQTNEQTHKHWLSRSIMHTIVSSTSFPTNWVPTILSCTNSVWSGSIPSMCSLTITADVPLVANYKNRKSLLMITNLVKANRVNINVITDIDKE